MSSACWVLAFDDGQIFDDNDGGEPHFTTAADAIAAYPNQGAHPKQLDKPCVHIACAFCGTWPDEDGEDHGYLLHFPDLTEAQTFVRALGWTVRGDLAWCPDEECTAVVPAPVPDGQTQIDLPRAAAPDNHDTQEPTDG
jgi:hypothetical protein